MNPRYELSANGQEVTDHQTGLIWRKNPEEGKFTFNEAQAHAKRIAQQTGLPWRVPTLDELTSLVDRTLTNPASTFPDIPSECFWSSLPCLGDTNYAWYVFFDFGYVYFSYRFNTNAVRLVRGG